jgi:hypothetical protein
MRNNMPRPRTTPAAGQHLNERVRIVFDQTPLHNLVPLMQEIITSIAGTSDSSGKRGVQAAVKLVEYYERLFHSGFGPRFVLDAWFANNVCNQWACPLVYLPRQIIPVYGGQWGYSLLPGPWTTTNPLSIYAVCFPGRSEITDLNLLEYAWLNHELGHHLLSRSGKGFAENFKPRVVDFVKTALRKTTADSAKTRAKSKELAIRTASLWTPRPNTRDWAHELAADAIALWTCGPAFLGAMQHVIENESIDPYEISESHPPYELRLRILIELAENLEWGNHCTELKTTMKRWSEAEMAARKHNEYSALAENTLGEECSAQIVQACRTWGLPQCTPELLHEVEEKAQGGQNFDSAVDLILAAWSVYRAAPNQYDAWEASALAQLANDLNS